MLALPWKSDEKPEKSLLDKEIERQLKIMESAEVDSPEYKFAFENFKDLHTEKLSEEKLKEKKRSRWFDAAVTVGLATLTLTTELWSPITSKWASAFMRPFRHRDEL